MLCKLMAFCFIFQGALILVSMSWSAVERARLMLCFMVWHQLMSLAFYLSAPSTHDIHVPGLVSAAGMSFFTLGAYAEVTGAFKSQSRRTGSPTNT
jgi:hypothetical protein